MVFASGVSVSGYVCMVAGCGNTVYARGLCRHHYDRDRYAGSPIIPFRTRLCPIGHYFQPSRVDQIFCSGRHRSKYKRLSDKDPLKYPPNPKPPCSSSRSRPRTLSRIFGWSRSPTRMSSRNAVACVRCAASGSMLILPGLMVRRLSGRFLWRSRVRRLWRTDF